MASFIFRQIRIVIVEIAHQGAVIKRRSIWRGLVAANQSTQRIAAKQLLLLSNCHNCSPSSAPKAQPKASNTRILSARRDSSEISFQEAWVIKAASCSAWVIAEWFWGQTSQRQ